MYDRVSRAAHARLVATAEASGAAAPYVSCSRNDPLICFVPRTDDPTQLPSELHSEELKMLKIGIKKLYHKHVTGEVKADEGAEFCFLFCEIQFWVIISDPDRSNDFQRQRHYLEKSVESLKSKLEKDAALHKKENLRIMRENVTLIGEINELRKEVKSVMSMSSPVPHWSPFKVCSLNSSSEQSGWVFATPCVVQSACCTAAAICWTASLFQSFIF